MRHEIDTTFLKENEVIMMILHRHWIVIVFKVIYLLMLLVSTIFILTIQGPIISVLGGGLFWALLTMYWVSFLLFIFLSWVNDELDLFVITNERVIGIEQIGALTRQVTECSLDKVQEVNSSVSGILPTLFGYGKVDIHTASETSNMNVTYAPNPVENARKINTIIQGVRSAKNTQNAV